ncbi:MAG: response regulator, partial [Elusimicrobia bacterium]|nr:response regulator [Elusimicrobiota bacterium]
GWLPLVRDDSDNLIPGDKVILIAEDDVNFSLILLECARRAGFKGIVVQRGDLILPLIQKFRPNAVTLDIRLPDMDGWRVLDLLKHDPQTRHIPIQVISGDEDWLRSRRFGAWDCLQKPVEADQLAAAFGRLKEFLAADKRQLLIVREEGKVRNAWVELLAGEGIAIRLVETGAEALRLLRETDFDCLLLDWTLPDMIALDLLEKVRSGYGSARTPFLLAVPSDINAKDEQKIRRIARSIVLKQVESPEKMLDEATLYLHRPETGLAEPLKRLLDKHHKTDPVLSRKKVLIVDDDVRNIFALTSVLERQKIEVIHAENGRDGIRMLESHLDVDAVLMDVMMPDMDGYETVRAIRKMSRFKNLPIIALTAKAMKGDREKCIEAGASDYIAKPVEINQLLSMLRVWINR